MLAQQILNGVVSGAVYVLFALGFTLIFGINNILNLAHGAVLMAGAFFALFLVLMHQFPLALALLGAAVFAGLLSILLDVIAFQPLRRRESQEFSAIVSSIGASLVIMSVAQRLSETRVMRFPVGSFPIVIYDVFGLRIQLLQTVILVCSVVLVFAIHFYLHRTQFGQRVRAVAVSERTAQLLGINPRWVFLQIFFLAGALAGIAGVLISLSFNSVHFMMGDPFLLRAFVIVVLGGLGSIWGAVAAGMIIGVLQSLSVAYFSSGIADLIVFSTLFATLLLRPTGLFGSSYQTAMRVQRL